MGKVEINQSKARAVVQVVTRRELGETAERIYKNALIEVPVKTGRLRASHRIERVSEDELRVSANTPYASKVFDGEGPGGSRRPNRWLTRAADRSRV